jgi:hypothetical protein
MAGAATAAHHGRRMRLPTDILLAEYDAPDGRRLVIAELDELTLTYTIVARSAGGKPRRLRRHFHTLADARAWANANRPTCL